MNKLRIIATITTIFAMTIACQKADHNGDLGGFWQLLQLEQNGNTINKKEDKIFWRIQLNLIQISGSYGRFEHTGDSLFIRMIDVNNEKALVEYGLNNAKEERFAVEILNNKSMRLRSKDARLTFRKF